MSLVKIVDLETGAETQQETILEFPNTVYRNNSTRALDTKYARHLSQKISPIPLGSCFTEGEIILHPFIDGASLLGFYFGVESSCFQDQTSVRVCEQERTLKRETYKGREILLPIDLK